MEYRTPRWSFFIREKSIQDNDYLLKSHFIEEKQRKKLNKKCVMAKITNTVVFIRFRSIVLKFSKIDDQKINF